MNLKKDIKSITLGIRHSRSFRLRDESGRLVDDIVYNEDSPFGAEMFPEVRDTNTRERILFNSETDEYIRINTDDLILKIKVDGNFDAKIKFLNEKVLPYFKTHLFKKYELININRIGIIFGHEISDKQKLKSIIPLITQSKINKAQNINLTFSVKDDVQESLYRKNVNDFKNYIFSFSEIKDDKLEANLDFQYYYEPVFYDLRECDTEKFINDAITFLENKYYPWIFPKHEKE